MAVAFDTSERGVTPKYLSKVWRISFEDTKRTIDVTSQLSVTPKDPILANNYGTNDRMLRYNISSWIRSMLPSTDASHQGATPAVNCL
jgi:hypothetical protein